MKFKSNPFFRSAALAFVSLSLGTTAHADIFDLNDTAAGFGVADGGSYDWLTVPAWSDGTIAANDEGTAATVAWQGTASVTEQAYFVGSGIAGENYTVRLGPSGTTDTYLQNLAINAKADGSGALPLAAGNVTIGNTGDAGNLILRAENSIGTQASGTLTINNGVNLNGVRTNFRGGNVVINGSIFGTGASIISLSTGAFGLTSGGTLTLAGDNSYAGTTSIASGYALNIRHANALGGTSSGTTVSPGGALQIQGGITTAAEALSLNGTGISTTGALRNISGVNNYAGLVTLAGASRINSDSGTLTLSNAGTITGATFGLTIGGAGNTTINSIIGTTTGTLAKDGGGILTLSGVNTYTGATTITNGTLTVSSTGVINNANANTGTGSISGGGTLRVDGGTAKFNVSTNGSNSLVVGTTTAGNVVVTNNGTLNVNTGRLILGGSAAGTGTSTFTQDTGTTTVASNFYTANYHATNMNISGGSFTVSGSSILSQRATTNFNISGTANVTFNANVGMGGQAGTYTSAINLSGGNCTAPTLTLGAGSPATNTLTATVNLTGGTMAVNNIANGINGTTAVNFDGGTLKARAASADFVNADSVFVKTGGATIDTNAFDVTIDNPLLQFEATTGSLTKSGSGTLTLAAANTYTGSTVINAGTLALGATGSIANSTSTTIAAGAKLETILQSTYAIPASKTVTFSLNAADAGSSGQINAAGLDITNATVAFEITNGPLDDAAYVLATYGVGTLTGTAFASVTPPSGYTLNYAYNGGTQIALVQETPATGYGSWATANVNDQTADLDYDNDGVDNGVEYFMGETGTSFTSSPTSFTGSTATWTNGGNIPSSEYGTQFVIQTSTDLVTWENILINNPSLNNQSGSVAFTLTGSGKQFARLQVTPN